MKPRSAPGSLLTRLGALGLNARVLVICGLPLLITVLITTLVVQWSTRRFVEDAIGEQMVMQARIVSHLVAIASQPTGVEMSPEAINGHLKAITRFAKAQMNYDYEFWVTDSAGKVCLGSQGVDFTFTPDQPQAGVFLRLLNGHTNHTDVVVQESRRREIDPFIYKYVAVSGVDMPRIVEVGYKTESLLAVLSRKNLLLALGVAALLLASGILAYFLLSRTLTAPLDQLVRAARAVEREEYQVGTLERVRARGDELGRLASVFEDMVVKLASRHEELVNFMRSAVIKVRGDGVITFANIHASELFGFSRTELVGGHLRRIVPPERQAQAQAQIEATQDQQVRINELRENVAKSGRRIWMAWSIRLIAPGEGSAKEFLYVGNDVTEEVRQKQELEELVNKLAAQGEQLKASEERSRLILEFSAEGIYGTDNEGRITFVNPAACRMFGFTVEELIGQPSHEAIHHHHPDGREYPMEECPMYAAYTVGRASRIDDEFLWRKDGTGFPVEYGATPILKDGVVIGSVVTFTDISERRRIEVELKRLNFMADQALELTQAGYWHVPLDGSGWYNSSERAARIFGDPPNPDHRYTLEHWLKHVHLGDEAAAKVTAQNFEDAVTGRVPVYDATYA